MRFRGWHHGWLCHDYAVICGKKKGIFGPFGVISGVAEQQIHFSVAVGFQIYPNRDFGGCCLL